MVENSNETGSGLNPMDLGKTIDKWGTQELSIVKK